MSDRESRELLAKISLFEGLTTDQLEALLEVARKEKHPARFELFHKGDQGRQVYVIASGLVKVLATSRSAKEIVFAMLERGDVVGEIALLHGGHRTATVVTVEPSEFLVIDRRDFVPFLERHPRVAIRLLELASARVRRLSEQMEDAVFLNLPSRLAKKLVSLSRAHGHDDGNGVRIDLQLSQQDLGQMVGTSRESVNKQIKLWEDEGLLSMHRGVIVLHRPEEMESLAGIVL